MLRSPVLTSSSANRFLETEGYVDTNQGNLELASLCINYLNLPGLRNDPGDKTEFVLTGYYAFMDYAVSYWVRHLETCLVKLSKGDAVTASLAESLEAFVTLHYTESPKKLQVSKGNKARLQCFEEMDFHGDLQQAVISARKQLTFHGEIEQSEIVLDLVEIVEGIRLAFERLLGSSPGNNNDVADKLTMYYGSNLFKCPRLSCKYFSNGFATADQRNQHISKHIRPFRCTVMGCPSATMGLSTGKDLQKHMKDCHEPQQDGDFPDEREIHSSLQQMQARPPQPEKPIEQTEQSSSDDEAEQQPAEAPKKNVTAQRQKVAPISRKRQRREHKCRYCGKTFDRKFNLDSHLITHTADKPWACEVCGKAFARESDCRRHTKGHTDEVAYTCSGRLSDGTPWGCGRSFARSDTLANHHRSKAGQKCTAPRRQEEGI